MLKTWSFWKTFFATYLALVGGIWGFVEAYTYFESDALKRLLGSNWWIYYYVVPLFIAILFAVWIRSGEDGQAESLDQHNRRVMLNHVENFWIKGILEKSLHGAALLELGIKEDPSAINYPWAIKRESTNETLPAGKSMLEIFEEIGAGRSLLVLGAPGSGKTTMLLELARQLTQRARNDENEPIPVVFNLASWTEKQTLAAWLADQLNIIYYVPKKTAPKWVAENKMLLLLDGLDEVKKEIREKCVGAIKRFRNEHGLTSLVVCSRVEEYQELSTKLSLDGAIKIQPLTSEQVNAYFNRFGNSLASIRQLLDKDKDLKELAETPLILSIMTLAYKDKEPEELPTFTDKEEQRKHLFNAYISRMFERPTRTINSSFTKAQTLHYLSWLARKMIEHNMITYQIETMQSSWLEDKKKAIVYTLLKWDAKLGVMPMDRNTLNQLRHWKSSRINLVGTLMIGLVVGLIIGLIPRLKVDPLRSSAMGIILGFYIGWLFTIPKWLFITPRVQQESIRISQYLQEVFFITVLLAVTSGLVAGFKSGIVLGLFFWTLLGLSSGLIWHYTLRFILIRDGFIPWRLFAFLDYAVNLIFLRRVGRSYIFVHRLLMEHFAEMDA